MDPTTLHICLFDKLELRLGESELLALESARAQSLLAYLLLHRAAPQPRQRLAFILWPDSTDAQARTNLRHVLHNLKHALPFFERFVHATTRTLQWRSDAPYALDVASFEQLVAGAEHEQRAESIKAARAAVELYRGDLLETCYDEWIDAERARLRSLYVRTLEQLGAELETAGEGATAIVYAERLLRADSLHEGAYRLLMRAYRNRGEHARALRVYHVCTTTLARELGVQPSPETQHVYATLLPPEPARVVPDGRSRPGGRAPLVGRAAEWERLTESWSTAETGRAHFVLVSGEAGIGKTRLTEELRTWCAQRGALTAEARCFRAEGALPYAPLVAWLRSPALEMRLPQLSAAHCSELARLLPDLVGNPDNVAAPLLSDAEQRHRLFDALAHALATQHAALLLILDDVQWCDEATLQFVHYLLRADPNARLLLVATARRENPQQNSALPEFIAALHALDLVTEIELLRLTHDETRLLGEHVSGQALEPAQAGQLYRETEGNPLFAVEALRAGWPAINADGIWITPKVQAAIASRLAQLSDAARTLARVSASIGREFTSDVLAYASDIDANTLVGGLDELWRAGIVREHGADAYDFSHDKIREVAYNGLGAPQRRHHHVRIAEALKRVRARDPRTVTAQIAAHYDRAGVAEEAVTWYEEAAQAAQQLHVHTEAVRLLERALEILDTLPPSSERSARELAILIALLPPVSSVEGFGSPLLRSLLERAVDCSSRLAAEPSPQLLRFLAISTLARGDAAAARGFGEQLYARGARDMDDVLLVEADYMLGIAAFWQGEFPLARTHFEAAVARYRPEHRRTHLLRFGVDPQIICLSRLANTLWFLGEPHAAVRARDSALELGRVIQHRQTQDTVLVFAATLALDSGDHDAFREYARDLSSRRPAGYPGQIDSVVAAFEGFAAVLDGHADEGLQRMHAALNDLRGTDHAPGMHAQILHAIVVAAALSGSSRIGLAAAERALAMGGANRVWEAHTRRARAEFLALPGKEPAAVET